MNGGYISLNTVNMCLNSVNRKTCSRLNIFSVPSGDLRPFRSALGTFRDMRRKNEENLEYHTVVFFLGEPVEKIEKTQPCCLEYGTVVVKKLKCACRLLVRIPVIVVAQISR